ncbi:MAG: DUF2752 domain-containing protein [Flavobacteriales bacterium]|nr:DUF2752 domain-containing protein [Flavobacteriales bacterium]
MTKLLPWLIGLLAISFLVVLWYYDPEQSLPYLPCPFHWLTGLYCPGCGSQRALHDLLHGRLGDAFGHNAALICAGPLLGLQWGIGRWRGRPLGHDNRVVFAWAAALLAWGVLRNLHGLEVLAP